MKKIILFVLLILLSIKAYSQDTFLLQSKRYYDENKLNESNFYLALHINHEIEDVPEEIPIVFDYLIKRGMKPTSFIDGSYSYEFLMFFFSDTLFQWNSNIYDEKSNVILTRIGKDQKTNLYAAVWGRPRMEMWSVIGETSNTSFLLGYSDADVVVGKYNSNGHPVPCSAFNIKGPFTHLYNPTFYDFDKDGFPEMVLKFNISVADGFIQFLNIYKSKNNKDFCQRNLLKEFSARNGFVKHSNDRFTIGTQTRDGDEGWIGASLHEVKEILYDGQNETIVEVKTIPNESKDISSINEPIVSTSSFVMEKHLEDFIYNNWRSTIFGRDYNIFKNGRQFQTDTGPLDILAHRKDEKEFLVLELKRDKASDVVVGQTLRYMGYIKNTVAKKDQTVRGCIIATDEDQGLKNALSVTPDIDFYKYNINFTLNKI